MRYAIYTTLLLLLGVITLPYGIFLYLTTPKYRHTVWPRFGLLSPALCADVADHPCFWLHAVSVGEVMAALPLVAELHRSFPELRVVVSTVTKTGQQVAR